MYLEIYSSVCSTSSLFFMLLFIFLIFFFFNDTATTEIYTLSLHDALPISEEIGHVHWITGAQQGIASSALHLGDRKSTRLNSSHPSISYAVFCLKKKKKKNKIYQMKIND